MKKMITALLAAAMVLSLAACGSGASSSASTTAAPAATEAAPAKTDTDTVAVGAVIIARDDIPEDEIYTFIKTIFENSAAITEQHAKGGELDLAFASSVTSVPYHPGAAKYFAEQGITVEVANP